MKRNIQLIFCSILMINTLPAQVEVLSLEANYTKSLFYSVTDGSTSSYNYTDWDIAFGVGPQSLAVLYNEGTAGDLGEIELYLTDSTDFATLDTTGMVRIYNNEVSWEAGAFNHVGNAADPFDLGWGSYSVVTHQVNGTRVFVIKLRNGDYKKLKIESLISGVYSFRYADLDGENEVMKTVEKSAFSGKTLAYYSFETEAVVDLEPEEWDILFTRYYTSLPLDDGTGTSIEYLVTGALINAGLEIAQVDGIDPATVDYSDYPELFNDTLTVIGHDWKSFNLSDFQYSVPADRVYFIKKGSGAVWKVQFIDFEGASTGGFALEKSQVGTISSSQDLSKNFQSFRLFPNPAGKVINVNFELETRADQGQVQIMNQLGQVLWTENIRIHEGMNSSSIPLELAGGAYYLTIQSGRDFIARPFSVNP